MARTGVDQAGPAPRKGPSRQTYTAQGRVYQKPVPLTENNERKLTEQAREQIGVEMTVEVFPKGKVS